MTLNRVDWGSLQAHQSFFRSREVQEKIADYQEEGVSLEYANSNLESLIPVDQIPDIRFNIRKELIPSTWGINNPLYLARKVS
jgi:hypothetical protein